MKIKRKIIEIDEEKCNGCGKCIISCAEGALKLINGKAKLVSDVYCDGLGDCIGECPEDALRIVEREAELFDEEEVKKHLEKQKKDDEEPPMVCGCPSTMVRNLKPENKENNSVDIKSELNHWPVKLQLLGPHATFLKGSDLVLLADCAAVSEPNLHKKVIKNHTIAINCPKFGNLDADIARLTEILKVATPKSLTVIYMEVPCCGGLLYSAKQAIDNCGLQIPLKRVLLSVKGEILQESNIY